MIVQGTLLQGAFFLGCCMKQTRILFVCHGNICRSLMAEFVMKDMMRKAGLENGEVADP